MKYISFPLFFLALAMPSAGESADTDLIENIRLIVNDAVNDAEKRIIAETKTEIDKAEKSLKAYVDLKIENLDTKIDNLDTKIENLDNSLSLLERTMDKRLSLLTTLFTAMIALIVLAIGIPQILMVSRSRKDREQDRINSDVRQEIETLKQQRIVKP